jgi:probable addiction module antidote protein
MPTFDYDDYLIEQLKDPDYAAGYLTACLEEGEDVFLSAIKNVAKAQGGIKTLADSTQLNRENLYDMLSEEGNPRFRSLTAILDRLGFKVSFSPKLEGEDAA